MLQLQLNEATAARRRIPLKALDASGGELTGLTFPTTDKQVSKNGGTFANGAGTVTEIGLGSYFYVATVAELDTLGYLEVRFVNAGMEPFYALAQVGGIRDVPIEGTLTDKQIMRLLAATQAGEVVDADTNTPEIKAAGAPSKKRIDAITDVNGNRNTIVLDVTDQ